jgi:hypothetical protein
MAIKGRQFPGEVIFLSCGGISGILSCQHVTGLGQARYIDRPHNFAAKPSRVRITTQSQQEEEHDPRFNKSGIHRSHGRCANFRRTPCSPERGKSLRTRLQRRRSCLCAHARLSRQPAHFGRPGAFPDRERAVPVRTRCQISITLRSQLWISWKPILETPKRKRRLTPRDWRRLRADCRCYPIPTICDCSW